MPPPAISVCMPMYNASRYLRECIDSVLAQTFTDFEFLIVDDGSTDNSVEIVESYSDPRIRLIKRRHDYIASLNCLLDEAKGKYIARMDADDIMLPHRIQIQFEYMEADLNVDVLGGEVVAIDGKSEQHFHALTYISPWEMIDGCCLAHPTVMIRQNTIKRYGFRYKEDNKFAEDYGLWFDMLRHNCILRNLCEPLVKYRLSESQVSVRESERQAKQTQKLRQNACDWLVQLIYSYLDKVNQVYPTKQALSVIIPFLNEGEEIVNTVKSIRETASAEVEIIVVDDCSYDNINYIELLAPHNVRYYRNEIRMGAALSKEKGVKLASNEYFIILDSHMRAFTSQWDQKVLFQLQSNPKTIYCCKTLSIEKDRHGKISIDTTIPENRAAYLTFREDKLMPSIHWYERPETVIPGLKDTEICAILGASYASSKTYWNNITGMCGLLHFGCEEACLSLKSWLVGGGCHYIQDVVFGHIYKTSSNYYFSRSAYLYNYIAISDMLFPFQERYWCRAIMRHNEPIGFERALQYVSANSMQLKAVRERFKGVIDKNFQKIVDINLSASVIQKGIPIDSAFIHTVARQIVSKGSQSRKIGLLDGGACGILIFLLEYIANYGSTDEALLNLIHEQFETVKVSIINNTSDWTLYSGFAGVGIGLLYIMQHKLVDDDLSDILCEIDGLLSQYSPTRLSQSSYKRGIGGLFCYVVHRLTQDNISHNLNDSFLSELCSCGKKLLRTILDYRTSSYIAQYIHIVEGGPLLYQTKSIYPSDIITPSRFIPENVDFWILDGMNVLGYATELMFLNRLKNKYEEKYI